MAQLRISITQLVALGFAGRSVLNRYPDIDPERDAYARGNNGDPYVSIPVLTRPDGLRTGQLGTAVWDTFTLRVPAKSYSYSYDRDPYSIQLPDATLVEFSRSKNIVKTQVPGRDGTVKELISLDDWSISVKAVAVNIERLEYPHEYINRLLAFLEHKGALEVVSEHFAQKGIQYVAVESVHLPQVEGFPSLAPIQLQLSSDVPVELRIKQDLNPNL